jgi:N-acetylglucosaminyldiphosphoundecaprenol N-acetyl-beta-D-mannosaminyltransferase
VASIDILGCRVDAVERDEAVARIAALAQGSSGALVVTLGVEMIMAAQCDAEFRRLINTCALSVCDSIGVLAASRMRGGPLRERVTGVELVDLLAERSARTGDLRLFLLGAAEGTAAAAAERLTARYPGVRIAGTRNGYFQPDESSEVARTIAASGANVLLAGLGFPKQEKWIARFGAAAGCGVGLGVGGSFDVLAGKVRRAPRAIQRAGLEWAYRLIREPSRWRRQVALPRFAVAQTREWLSMKLRKRSHE